MQRLTIHDLDGLTTSLIELFPALEADATRQSLSALLRGTCTFTVPCLSDYRRASHACALLLAAIDRAAHDVDAFDAHPLARRLCDLRDHVRLR